MNVETDMLKGNEMAAVWADGTWCYMEDLEEYLSFMSDDYHLQDIERVLEEYEREYYEKRVVA